MAARVKWADDSQTSKVVHFRGGEKVLIKNPDAANEHGQEENWGKRVAQQGPENRAGWHLCEAELL